VKQDSGYGYLFVNWILGCIMVLFFLFGFGKILFQEYLLGTILIVLALAAGSGIVFIMNRIGWKKIK
jgi:ACR3 family arsenite efflux pump ArsB